MSAAEPTELNQFSGRELKSTGQPHTKVFGAKFRDWTCRGWVQAEFECKMGSFQMNVKEAKVRPSLKYKIEIIYETVDVQERSIPASLGGFDERER